LIWKNSFWNLVGISIPLVISLLTIGYLSRILGQEKFGLFLIVFSILGYASIFDAGLSRAVVRFIALCNDNVADEKKIIGTSVFIVTILSVGGSLLFFYNINNIVLFLNISDEVFKDVTSAFFLLSFIIPPTIISMILLAFLEGKQQFLKLNIYKSITGTIIAISPLVGVFIIPTLEGAMLGFLIGRVLSLIISYLPIYNYFGSYKVIFDFNTSKELFQFGGWITLSNLISPLMVNSDRFILSNVVGAGSVSFYAGPSEIISRMGIIPGAIAKTIFPLFTKSLNNTKPYELKVYYGLSIIMLLLIAPVFVFSQEIIVLIFGSSYIGDPSFILKILLVGFFFNSLAQIPFSKIQAYGNSKLTAFIHLSELVPYFIILYYMVESFGIIGAAAAWSLRVIIDFLILFYFSKKCKTA